MHAHTRAALPGPAPTIYRVTRPDGRAGVVRHYTLSSCGLGSPPPTVYTYDPASCRSGDPHPCPVPATRPARPLIPEVVAGRTGRRSPRRPIAPAGSARSRTRCIGASSGPLVARLLPMQQLRVPVCLRELHQHTLVARGGVRSLFSEQGAGGGHLLFDSGAVRLGRHPGVGHAALDPAADATLCVLVEA